VTWNPREISNNALRGASSLRKPPGMGHFLYVNADYRKKIVPYVEMFHAWGFENTVRVSEYFGGLRFQPSNSLNFSLNPSYSRFWRRQDQFVDQVNFNGSERTIVSQVEQRTLRLVLRLNYNITPELTVQYYGQPFISRALYKNFGYVTDPLNKEYNERFHRFSSQEITFADGAFSVDENHDGQTDYTFQQPDFNFVQFRSNLVIRWEYVAGSEVYLVWSQSNSPENTDFDSRLAQSLFDHLFEQKAHNIFLVKFTYRFLL
jgi:hypothetical protein